MLLQLVIELLVYVVVLDLFLHKCVHLVLVVVLDDCDLLCVRLSALFDSTSRIDPESLDNAFRCVHLDLSLSQHSFILGVLDDAVVRRALRLVEDSEQIDIQLSVLKLLLDVGEVGQQI